MRGKCLLMGSVDIILLDLGVAWRGRPETASRITLRFARFLEASRLARATSCALCMGISNRRGFRRSLPLAPPSAWRPGAVDWRGDEARPRGKERRPLGFSQLEDSAESAGRPWCYCPLDDSAKPRRALRGLR